jgi:hypothetical protein
MKGIFMKKIVGLVLLMTCIFSLYAKTPLTICTTSITQNFPAGNGTVSNPYIVCNNEQFKRISTDNLTSDSFKLGKDIDFEYSAMEPIGSKESPYIGQFNGDGYTLSHVFINKSGENVGIFSKISSSASISHLYVNNIHNSTDATSNVGSVVGYADDANIIDVHISNATIIAPDSSGLLVGKVNNATISNCSVHGKLRNKFGADAGGGLVGLALNSSILRSSVIVNIEPYNQEIFGISDIGGVVGYASETTIDNVYVLGEINYSTVGKKDGPKNIGGLIGRMINNTTLNHAYVVAPLIINARNIGAAVGRLYNVDKSQSQGVVWNDEVSNVDISELGQGVASNKMGDKLFWVALGFKEDFWTFNDGQYPSLR